MIKSHDQNGGESWILFVLEARLFFHPKDGSHPCV
jgi:hypothetical protein